MAAYTSKYTGEQIDEVVGKVLDGTDIDTVENAKYATLLKLGNVTQLCGSVGPQSSTTVTGVELRNGLYMLHMTGSGNRKGVDFVWYTGEVGATHKSASGKIELKATESTGTFTIEVTATEAWSAIYITRLAF